ncbi:hypothetical protein HMSSN139_52210 [Paenibacillus sp. HMSSN-139]|nr:hypothetical protein HMSSN139_52210 [Paenibacillus sp. HMSSN-139]
MQSQSLTQAGTVSPSASIFSTERINPMASHVSNGPSSQLKPHFIASSISRMLSAISPSLAAE